MKPAISITTILGCVLATGLASAQSPSIIQNARDTMNGVSARETAASNEALGLNQPAPKATTHVASSSQAAASAPAKTSSIAVSTKPSSPKKFSHAKRGAVVVQQAAKPAPAAAPEEHASASAPAASSGAGDSQGAANEQPVTPDTKYAANGRRDPFISPVVSHAGGSGCNTGKKCLEIGAINLRGVVHAESGFIAVVSNGLNKAYFLRENDPVFNGYVMKITGDSIVFQETLQDRLGKSFTREVVKKITTPAV
jgi:hypothetical protein